MKKNKILLHLSIEKYKIELVSEGDSCIAADSERLRDPSGDRISHRYGLCAAPFYRLYTDGA